MQQLLLQSAANAPSTATPSNQFRGSSSSSKMGAVTYGKSWAEDIQTYHVSDSPHARKRSLPLEQPLFRRSHLSACVVHSLSPQAAKATLPWVSAQQTPVKYVTRFEKSREEREYDLVLGRFRDAEREASLEHHEKDKLQVNLESAKAKQLRNVQRFNVVNHSPMYQDATDPKEKPPQPHPYRKKIASDFNIISNRSYSNNNSSSQDATATASPNRPSSKRPTREFNILTNKYHENHDTRSQLDDSKKKELAAIKYNASRDYDPVRITYVDPDKEQTFLKAREHKQAIHGQDRVLLLPPREQFSEGHVYNILNQQVFNPEKLVTMVEKRDQRALNKMQKTAFEAKMRDVGEAMRTKETQLCLNRYAHERNSQTYVHGYDPISNQSFDGRHAKPKMPTRTHASLSAWQVLESGVPVQTKISPQQDASSSKPAIRTAPPSSHTQRDKNENTNCLGLQQRPNILVVDHAQQSAAPQSVKMPSETTSKKTTPLIRTGGFSH